MINSKIKEARYNKKYKELEKGIGKPGYLKKESLEKIEIGDRIRALIRIRCGNMEENNKYWMEEKNRICIFCEGGNDSISHYVKECAVASEWFKELDNDVRERLQRLWNENLDERKGKAIIKL